MTAPARQRLCEAAQGLLASGRPQDISIRAIAGAAGANSSLISYYFGGLEGLLAEAQRSAAMRLSEAVRASEAGEPEDGALTALLIGEAPLLRAAFAPVGVGARSAIPEMVTEAIASRLPASVDQAVRARRILAWAVFRVLIEGAEAPGPEDVTAAEMRAYAAPESAARPAAGVRTRRRSEFID